MVVASELFKEALDMTRKNNTDTNTKTPALPMKPIWPAAPCRATG